MFRMSQTAAVRRYLDNRTWCSKLRLY